LKKISWQEVADRLYRFTCDEKLIFTESLISAHLSYNFLVENRRGQRICSERDLYSLVDLLIADYQDNLRRSGRWEREFKDEIRLFFAYLAVWAYLWGSSSLAYDLTEQLNELF
jgi:hypothetical protein